MVKQVGTGRDDHKIVKVQSVAHISLSQAQGFKNKENHNKKDAHSRPSQRSTALTNKAKTFGENRAWEPLKSAEVPAVREAAVQIYKAEMGVASRPQLTDHVENNKRAQQSLDAAPLQPRHHKSQPQLKQQQPTLRRTQSRQLEKTDAPSFSMIDSELLGMCVPEEHELSGDEGFSEDLEVHTDNHSVEEVHDHGRWEESPPTLPDIAEEYRDEDDEDYDEQEQAYMTAHSLGGITTVLQPTVNTQVQSELERASLEVAQTRPQEDIEEEAWDVSMVAEYGEDIFKYMRELEVRAHTSRRCKAHIDQRFQVTMQPDPYYMDRQTEIQWSMRSVLMDWLVQVHNRFSLLPETLFLTVNYIDRFLSKKVVSIGKLQLVGATAILVASKYEEINCPSLQEIVYMVDNGYSVEEILKAERFMLSMLGFELGWPGPMSFLRRVSKADDYDLETRTLAKYFLELTIMDERFVSTPPSFLAAGAHCLSRLILEKGDWVSLLMTAAGT